MTKKAFVVVGFVILLPAISYLLIKYLRDEAVVMPARYFADTIVTRVVNGKETMDTVWHRVSNIGLTNQMGQHVSLDDLDGKVILADFFFTRCPTLCPKLTRNMKVLHDALKTRNRAGLQDTARIQFLSFTVDPDRDSVEALRQYGQKHEINPDSWWLLTGPKKKIYDFAMNELRLGVPDSAAVDTNFIHTGYFVLLDRKRVVRGFYHGEDSTELSRLAADMIYLTLEKDKKKKRNLFSSN